jgi:hypothetical protein
MSQESDEVFGLEVVVADPCRCGCPLISVHPHSTRSNIPIWRCVWCRKRRGKPTAIELALLNAWLKEYGYTLEPLCFCDDGGIRIAKLMLQHDAWLKKKQSNGRSWYDIITDTLDENWKGDGSDADKYVYDADAGDDAA